MIAIGWEEFLLSFLTEVGRGGAGNHLQNHKNPTGCRICAGDLLDHGDGLGWGELVAAELLWDADFECAGVLQGVEAFVAQLAELFVLFTVGCEQIEDAVEALHECVVLGAWVEAKGGRGEGGCHGVAPI